ncbi:MaoC family dehydratase N-terminal domain-containing protein [Amycolatopsis sp. 195334CR]|uniref:FAS1-like dehydratase domain-containing protein n=1 Tax=Amycolatopsis sp. 195334CR TaxID=2814588 RepID=UPI001A8C9A69|nr:MaoC family dehydratase N-terminal domain-containing protein [Amycolatopsis sp. 195334CR]MBN6040415.1 MaoC family dehydratase N-terminal domain-containing protein [Amycolatopsis sp. 195334CR]
MTALNQDFTGRSFPPSGEYLVSREKIAEFAAAVGADAPAHFDPEWARERGYPDVLAPPTFAILLALPAAERILRDEELGVDYGRLVHRDQDFRYHRPIHAGDRLTTGLTITDIRTTSANELCVLHARIADAENHDVCDVTMGFLVRT